MRHHFLSSAKIRSVQLDQVTLVSIVDDDELVREAMKSLVRSFGYRIVTFCSATEFLEFTRSKTQ